MKKKELITSTPASNELIEKLDHSNWEHRFLAAKKLCGASGKLLFLGLAVRDQATVKKRLVKLLDDENSQVRSQAANALGSLGIRDAIDNLVTALADPNDWVRVQVVEALGNLGNPFTAQILAQHLEAETEPHVRATLVKALGKIGDEKITPLLIVYLEDKENRVRANTVEALTQLKISKASLKPALTKLINDPNNRVRANVAMSLLFMGEDRGREILSSMLSSKDEFMRASAAYACGEVGQAEDRPALIRLLGDRSLMVRKNAVKALIKHGVKTLPNLFKALKSPDQVVRIGVLEVLGEFRDPSSRQPIIPLLEDESGEVRSKAEEILDLIDGY